MLHPDHCLNCNTALRANYQFCYKCGQPANTHKRITLKHIGHEVLHAVTHADKGFLFLTKALLTKPGTTIREYLDGKHKKYFNPFSFFFIVLGIYVLSNAFFKPFDRVNNDAMKTHRQVYPPSVKTPEQQARYKAKYEIVTHRAAKTMNFMNTKTNIILCISTPFIAAIMFLLYWRRVNYAEHLVVMIFVNTLLNLLSIFIFTPLMHYALNPAMYQGILAIMLLTHVVYLAIVYHGVLTQPNTIVSYFKCIVAAIIGIAGWVIISQVVINYYIRYGFL